jgi:hypothetical protein
MMGRQGWNSYITMNAFTPGIERRRKIDVKTVRTVYVEFDENGQAGLDKIEADIVAGIVPDGYQRPTCIIAESD